MATCASCGGTNPEGFRFCGSCGAALGAAPGAGQAREVRKTVTILFSDVTGSTAIGERLDPESMRRILGRTFASVKEILERHGGTVEKFIGDAVMAVFGVPAVHEDDALRAVRAAAEMRTALAAANDGLQRDHGVRIELRTGINTGEVVAGDPSAGQAFVTGDAVNVAARLEQAAQPGEILLGDATFRLVRDAIDAQPAGELDLKGKALPVRAHRLLAVDPDAPAHQRRLDAPLVGRVRELRLLAQAFERVATDRACQLFTILGTAGVGKSRLVLAFLEQEAAEATILRGRCLPYGQNITFWPIGEIVRAAAGIAPADPPTAARARLRALVEGDPDADLIAERISQALSLDEAEAPVEETFWAVRKLLEALARERPLVIVIDDLHWAAPTLLELIEHTADWTRDSPILLLGLSRPELLDARPGWGGGKLNATTILIEPLSGVECEGLVEQLLGQADLDPAIRRRISDAAEGNPLFVEELVSMLIDDGALRRGDDGRWAPIGDLARVTVPPTISALIAARLDRLSPADRAIVERGAVVGKVFWRGAVAELLPAEQRDALGERLSALIRRELIRPDRTTTLGDDGYRFRHLLIRDAAYDGLSKEVRADLHRRLAGWLEGVAGGRLAEYQEIVGYHLEQAHGYRVQLGPVDGEYEDAALRGAGHLAAAGRRALARGDLPAAVGLLDRATALLPPEATGRAGLLAALGSALTEQGEFGRAAAVFEGAAKAAESAGDEDQSYTSLTRLHLFFFTDPAGVSEATQREVERLIPLFEARDDHLGLAKARRRLAMVYRTRRDVRSMEQELGQAIEHARAAGDAREEARSLGLLATAGLLGPTPVPDAIERCRRIRAEAAGNRTVERAVLLALAGLEAMAGETEAAQGHLEEHRRLCAEMGLRLDAAEGAITAGFAALLVDDAETAERHLGGAVADLQAMGERANLATAAGLLGEARVRLGRLDEAVTATRVAEAAAAPDDLGAQATWRMARARALLRQNGSDDARRLADEAARLAGQTDSYQLRGEAYLVLAEMDEARGERLMARTAMEKAIAAFERKGSTVSLEGARRRLATLVDAAQPETTR